LAPLHGNEHPETHATNRRRGIMDFICMHYTFYRNLPPIIQVDRTWSQVYCREKYRSTTRLNRAPFAISRNFAAMLERIDT
jgi:hypothetical protein